MAYAQAGIVMTGDKALDRKLKKMTVQFQQNATRKAMRKTLVEFRKKARSLVPVNTGRLKKSIKSKASLRRKTGMVEGKVYVDYSRKSKRYAPYAHLVEFGTGPRQVKKSKMLVGSMPAQPFMTPAFNTEKNQAIKEWIRSFRETLNKAGL